MINFSAEGFIINITTDLTLRNVPCEAFNGQVIVNNSKSHSPYVRIQWRKIPW
jgi:hypothetical protein